MALARVLVLALLVRADAAWQFEALTGSAFNVPTPLAIRQEGRPDLRLTARYDTRPFSYHAPYYAWRIGRWDGGAGWEFEHIHHKVVLRDTTAEVSRFAVSHGYNLLFAVRGWERGPWVWRAGAGPVIGHPESVVRGLTFGDEGGLFNEGYYLAGAGLQAAGGWRWPPGARVRAAADVILSGAWIRVPVRDGSADVPNVAVHGILGVSGSW